MKIGTAGDLRRLDESVITDYGVDQAVLMENAGIAAREVIVRRWGVEDRNILAICGTGNNGGDGFALARLLYARGARVTVLVAGDIQRASGATATNYRILRQLSLEILVLDAAPVPALLNKIDFDRFDLIVDALFGVGLSRNVEGRLAATVNRINGSGVPVLSLDIPSGIDADSGQILGAAVRAEATVSFGIPKRGNLLYPGFALGGQLYLSEISFPPELTGDESMRVSVNVPPVPPTRDPAGHKGSFGKVLIVGGSRDYRGAPALAAGAALGSGAGYVRLAVPGELVSQIFLLIPEAVFLPQEGSGVLGAEHAPELVEHAAEADAVVLGPGLSTHPESLGLARDLFPVLDAPLVVDGDALTALAGRDELTRERGFPTILTPHPGEMARLLGSSVSEIEARRIETAVEAADRYASVVVLKGAHTIVTEPGGGAWINLTGNSGMGTAGSGDVLAGVVGTLAAAGMPALDAARLGVYLHGLAGDLAAEEKGKAGMVAGDILKRLPEAVACCPESIVETPFSGKIIRI